MLVHLHASCIAPLWTQSPIMAENALADFAFIGCDSTSSMSSQGVQALCTEASLHALRRQYPQIYDTHDKLLVDPATVRVSRTDFLSAFKAITPSSHRSAVAHARWDSLT